MNDLETRLTDALAARADLVRPETLQDLPLPAQVVPLWRRTSVVLAAVACLAVVATSAALLAGGEKDRPRPAEPTPTLELPPDVGRDWDPANASARARLDLDGDGTAEKVQFLAEPSKKFDGRVRLQTTLSTDGSSAYGIADLGTTIGTSALEPIDADDDGDQELVLLHELDPNVVGGLYTPVVFDLRDGLLVQAAVEDPDLLLGGNVPVPGSQTEFYDMVRDHAYWIENGSLFSSVSVDSFARGNMTLMQPENFVVDVREWRLDEDGTLRPGESSCLVLVPEGRAPCGSGAEEGFVPYLNSVSTQTIGVGESARFSDGYQFSARVEAVADPTLVVEGSDGRTLNYGLEIAAPRVHVQQPSIFLDGASFVVTSAADPRAIEVLVQTGDELQALEPVGDVDFGNGTTSEDQEFRSWLTRNGALVTVTEHEDGSWTAWGWQLVSGTEMAAFPWGTICFDDVDDPTSARSC